MCSFSPGSFVQKSSGRPSRPNSGFLPIAPRPSIESPSAAARQAAIPTTLPPGHPGTGAVPAHRPSPPPRSMDTQMASQSPPSASGYAHAHGHHRHHHPGARSTAPAVPGTGIGIGITTAPPPPSHFPLSRGSFATPALASVADIPVSMSMMDGQAFLFGDGGYADGGVFCSLDDLDVDVDVGAGALQGGMMQPEWGDQFWLGDDSV
ncbi:putative Cu-dependent DNA-binding protein [Aspergillus thermomutatus]|uniref:Uncharacterized protein n=1 Tax=Aspergillus thermomutatus TaxID=41047 RepID=A0A397GX96_ASPTH|nr:uncharacterized protein CDV56_105185 [Aspergillus thermomutatus]RHZ54144.1 hypothetical protein CDV56_105185 [Aspergillus thermomutatus]